MPEKECKLYKIINRTLIEHPNRRTADIDAALSVDYCYPILGRLQELEDFNDILDEIGLADRNYSGLLIEVRFKSFKNKSLQSLYPFPVMIFLNIFMITLYNHRNIL